MIEKWFKLKEHGTNARTEMTAGLTVLDYGIYCRGQPGYLVRSRVPFQQVFTATVISAIIGTLTMALAANHPIAVAPGMGMNAYFTSVVASQGSPTRLSSARSSWRESYSCC